MGEEVVVDLLPDHEDWCCAKGCAGYGFCVGCSGTEADCQCLVRTVRLYAARAWVEGAESLAADMARPIGDDGMRPRTTNPYLSDLLDTFAHLPTAENQDDGSGVGA